MIKQPIRVFVTQFMDAHCQYQVRIVGLAGPHPLTGQPLPELSEELTVWSTSRQGAYQRAWITTRLRFCGHTVITYVDGTEHRDERR